MRQESSCRISSPALPWRFFSSGHNPAHLAERCTRRLIPGLTNAKRHRGIFRLQPSTSRSTSIRPWRPRQMCSQLRRFASTQKASSGQRQKAISASKRSLQGPSAQSSSCRKAQPPRPDRTAWQALVQKPEKQPRDRFWAAFPSPEDALAAARPGQAARSSSQSSAFRLCASNSR